MTPPNKLSRLHAAELRRRQDLHEAFIADLSHELRTPLTAIQGYVETLLGGVPRRSTRDRFLKTIERNAGRLGSLLDGLLELGSLGSKARRLEAQSVRLGPMLAEAASRLRDRARRARVALRLKRGPAVTVRVNADELPRVLDNLIENGIKYNRRGGRVTLSASTMGTEGVVTVRDTGFGIPPDDLPRIFDRFYRSERTRHIRGSGLGLAIVREIVHGNGGRIWAESGPDGAAFHVSFRLSGARSRKAQTSVS